MNLKVHGYIIHYIYKPYGLWWLLLPIFILEPDINKNKKKKKGKRKYKKIWKSWKKTKKYISEKSILERPENHRRLVDESWE